jgi:hypothetical protein
MKGGNTGSKTFDVEGFDYDNVKRYGTVDMKGGKGKGKRNAKKSSSKFSDFDFEKEWKEFETSYNQKYGGASAKKPVKKASAKKASSAKKPAKKAATKPKRKTQRGGDEVGATYAPAQFFDANATMSAPSSGPVQTAYGLSNPVDGPDRNLAPYPESSGQQTGGAKKKKDTKKPKTATKTSKPKKDTKKKDSKKDSKKDTKSTGNKVSVLDKIKKFFAM